MQFSALMSSLKHPLVRDLAWAINSASLNTASHDSIPSCGDYLCLSHPKASPYALNPLSQWQDNSEWFHCWLVQLDQDPCALVHHLEQYAQYILGCYFEGLWHFYIKQHPNYQLLAKNVQLNSEEGTVGELDLIVRDLNNHDVIHIELACKFYCEMVPTDNLEPLFSWVGPALKDRLDQKFDKLIRKQVALAQHPLAVAFCKASGFTIDRSIAVVKGRLFQFDDPRPTLAGANTDQAQRPFWSWWKMADLNQPLKCPIGLDFQILTKTDWFSEKLTLDQTTQRLTYRHLTEQLQQTPLEHPVQVACFRSEQPWECGRLFIVPEPWLSRAKAQVEPLLELPRP
ncbi:MAG: DUF1853 family protein [Pseudomonadota bacterium]|nr:DUF1853 family protein [Pseudomonadota bacterium]